MSGPPVDFSKPAGPPKRGDLSMKMHTRPSDPDWRYVEFWTPGGEDFQIAAAFSDADGVENISTTRLDRREAKALRHWLDAALE